MQRSDNVFLLTLIDFLVQILFFGLLIFVVYQASEKLRKKDTANQQSQIKQALDTAGVSDIRQLNDELSKLAPVQLKGLNGMLGMLGGVGETGKALKIVKAAGGSAAIAEKLSRLQKLEEGTGKPPCLFNMRSGKRQAVPLARVTATNSTITFAALTPQLLTVLNSIGVTYPDVRTLGLSQFRRIFRKVVEKHPNCRYSLVFNEQTRLVDARDAAGRYFFLQITH